MTTNPIDPYIQDAGGIVTVEHGEKFNPHHDAHGRFSSGGGGAGRVYHGGSVGGVQGSTMRTALRERTTGVLLQNLTHSEAAKLQSSTLPKLGYVKSKTATENSSNWTNAAKRHMVTISRPSGFGSFSDNWSAIGAVY